MDWRYVSHPQSLFARAGDRTYWVWRSGDEWVATVSQPRQFPADLERGPFERCLDACEAHASGDRSSAPLRRVG
jgi:hypothetical protein